MEAFLSCLDEIALDGLDGKLISRGELFVAVSR